MLLYFSIVFIYFFYNQGQRMLSGGKAGLVSVDILRKEQEENRRREKHNQPLEGFINFSLLRYFYTHRWKSFIQLCISFQLIIYIVVFYLVLKLNNEVSTYLPIHPLWPDESRNAQTIFRDKSGKRRDLDSERDEQKKKAGEKAARDEKYAQWGKR